MIEEAPNVVTEDGLRQLLAQGYANKEIAHQLQLGEKTIKTHVSRVLMKLGLRDRVQAVIYAYEAGLILPTEE